MEEIWENIEDYEGLYQVSNLGRIKRISKATCTFAGRILKNSRHNRGYQTVDLSKNGVWKKYTVHRLVAKAFIPNPDNKPEVNHKDSNRSNNVASNLEWATSSENSIHAINFGFQSLRRGEGSPVSKLNDELVLHIRELAEE